MESVQSKFDQWFEKNEKQILQDFLQFLKFPSISTDPAYKDNCLQTAEWLRCYLQKIGMTAVLWENPGLPVVFAEYCKAGPSRPTILLYQHYDVQPVDPLDLWQSAPFEPAIKEGKIYARGASDNKGQCFLTITALKGLLQVANDLQINLKLFIEGEEESGGKGTQYVIEKKKEALKADYLFAIDFDLPEKGVPGLTLGFRGLVAFNIECTNAAVDLHSGAHGGIALNPNRILAEILSKLWDEDGRIAIPHFYDEVKVWKKEELEKIDLSFDEQTYRKEFGVGAFSKQKGISHREANWIYPTVEINGMWGGYTGAGFKTVIPAKAFAKISCRLVPEQDPKKIEQLVRDFFREHTPLGAELKVEFHHGASAYGSSFSSLTEVLSKSFEDVFQKPCRYIMTGGSVPIVKDLAHAAGAEAALFGFALDTDNIHAPNEHFHWDCFKMGYQTMGRIFMRLAEGK